MPYRGRQTQPTPHGGRGSPTFVSLVCSLRTRARVACSVLLSLSAIREHGNYGSMSRNLGPGRVFISAQFQRSFHKSFKKLFGIKVVWQWENSLAPLRGGLQVGALRRPSWGSGGWEIAGCTSGAGKLSTRGWAKNERLVRHRLNVPVVSVLGRLAFPEQPLRLARGYATCSTSCCHV